MKVFISWSGERSKLLAEALRGWLRKVLQACEPWMSSKDLQAGETWDPDLVGRLKDSTIGVLCLTPENRESPAVHFEAGAMTIAISGQTFVCPYLLGLETADLKWPFSRFQMVKANKAGTLKLVETVNGALPEKNRMSPQDLEEAFETWWPKLEERIVAIPAATTPVPKRSDREILEEILLLVREAETQTLWREPLGRGSPQVLAEFLADYFLERRLNPAPLLALTPGTGKSTIWAAIAKTLESSAQLSAELSKEPKTKEAPGNSKKKKS
jgi:hypothetical protein